MMAGRDSLNHETFATTTGTFGVWVLENEFGGQLIVDPVHFAANYAK